MLLWRVSSHSVLDGRGGLIASARWHSEGRPIVYLAESPAAALLEVLVHLELDLAFLPPNFRLLKADAPDKLSVRTISTSELSATWRDDVIATRSIGDQWLSESSSALLRVPSAIVPETWNVLLDPLHPEAKRIKVLWYRNYPWDERLLK